MNVKKLKLKLEKIVGLMPKRLKMLWEVWVVELELSSKFGRLNPFELAKLLNPIKLGGIFLNSMIEKKLSWVTASASTTINFPTGLINPNTANTNAKYPSPMLIISMRFIAA